MRAGELMTPQNHSAEKSALACLLDGASVYCAPFAEAHFARPDHQLVFRAIRELADERKPANIITVRALLESRGELESAGGDPSRFFDKETPCGGDALLADLFPHLESARRNRDAVLHIHKHLGDLTSLRVDASTFAEELAELAAPAALSDGGDSVADILAEMEGEEGDRDTFPTGLAPLDDHLGGGFLRGELGVFAAHTGGGKSALLVQAAVANADQGRKVIYYSLELGRTELNLRAAAIHAKVPMPRKPRPPWDARTKSALNSILHLPLKFRTSCGDQLADIAANIRAEVRAGRCDMVIVDYLQRVSNKCDTRELEVASIARALKSIAMRENVPVLTASQLNDNGALRESRAIGHDADFVLVIGEDDLLVDKFRRGPCGVHLPCHLIGAQSRFVPTAREAA